VALCPSPIDIQLGFLLLLVFVLVLVPDLNSAPVDSEDDEEEENDIN